MITALLIFFALILEYFYDPVSNMKNTAVIDSTFEKFRNLVKNYIDSKYYIYLLFPISIIIIYSVISTSSSYWLSSKGAVYYWG